MRRNQIGIELAEDVDVESLFTPLYGSFIVELAEDAELPEVADGVVVEPLGTTVEAMSSIPAPRSSSSPSSRRPGRAASRASLPTAAPARPPRSRPSTSVPRISTCTAAQDRRPRVVIPVFPGNNCEYDSARAFRAAGAEADTFVINNLTPEAVAESTHELARRIRASQIVMIPGGFSGGDEPDAPPSSSRVLPRSRGHRAVRDLLKARDGLMLGICNGFQA